MRPKVVLGILLLSAAIVLGAFFLKHSPAPAPVQTAPVAAAAAPPPAPVTAAPPQPVAVAKPVDTITNRDEYIREEKNRLSSLAMNDDAGSLSNILADLYSPDKEIRLAAVSAAEQFESTNAIPVLKAVAANTDDPQEAIAMLKAADWLSQPNADLTASGTPQLTPQQKQQIDQFRQRMQIRQAANQMEKKVGTGQSTTPSDANTPTPPATTGDSSQTPPPSGASGN